MSLESLRQHPPPESLQSNPKALKALKALPTKVHESAQQAIVLLIAPSSRALWKIRSNIGGTESDDNLWRFVECVGPKRMFSGNLSPRLGLKGASLKALSTSEHLIQRRQKEHIDNIENLECGSATACQILSKQQWNWFDKAELCVQKFEKIQCHMVSKLQISEALNLQSFNVNCTFSVVPCKQKFDGFQRLEPFTGCVNTIWGQHLSPTTLCQLVCPLALDQANCQWSSSVWNF